MGKTVRIAPKGKPRRRARTRPLWLEGLAVVAVGIGIALLLRLVAVQTYPMPSRAMENSLLAGDLLLVDKLSYGASLGPVRLPGWDRPQSGDVLVFRYPEDPRRVFAKRCVAVAGQTVEVRNKVIYVDGRRLPDPPFSKYIDARILPADKSPRDNMALRRVPSAAVFVVGDNRDNSRDSRHWGFVPEENVIGQVRWVLWSMQKPRAEAAAWYRRIRWARVGLGVR